MANIEVHRIPKNRAGNEQVIEFKYEDPDTEEIVDFPWPVGTRVDLFIMDFDETTKRATSLVAKANSADQPDMFQFEEATPGKLTLLISGLKNLQNEEIPEGDYYPRIVATSSGGARTELEHELMNEDQIRIFKFLDTNDEF